MPAHMARHTRVNGIVESVQRHLVVRTEGCEVHRLEQHDVRVCDQDRACVQAGRQFDLQALLEGPATQRWPWPTHVDRPPAPRKASVARWEDLPLRPDPTTWSRES